MTAFYKKFFSVFNCVLLFHGYNIRPRGHAVAHLYKGKFNGVAEDFFIHIQFFFFIHRTAFAYIMEQVMPGELGGLRRKLHFEKRFQYELCYKHDNHDQWVQQDIKQHEWQRENVQHQVWPRPEKYFTQKFPDNEQNKAAEPSLDKGE